jgi:MoaA/NifB/PqqE/SkfB family radical SAM enzyme
MHLEPTSRCTLQCPGCSRTWFSTTFNRPFPKHDINLHDLRKFLDCDSGRSIKKFLLCGNHGDPIYYPDLLSLIEQLRPSSVRISTNGSYAPKEFWQKLSDIMIESDVVYFSIDGTHLNNHFYRRNADWESIMQGLDIMVKSPAKIVWKSIIFRFNQDHIEEMKKIAKDHGAIFHIESTSYYGDKALQPTDLNLVRNDMTYEYSKNNDDLDPKCINNQHGYISADGYYWPCCLISNVQSLHKTELWKNRHEWHIKNNNLDAMVEKVNDWALKVKDLGSNSPPACRMHCKKGQKTWLWDKI